MTLEATKIEDHGCTKVVLAAAVSGGDVIQLADGRAAVVQGTGNFAIGDTVEAAYVGEYDVATATGTTFSAGDIVEWDDTNKLVVANTAGDFDLGRAVVDKASGPLVTRVRLNDTGL